MKTYPNLLTGNGYRFAIGYDVFSQKTLWTLNPLPFDILSLFNNNVMLTDQYWLCLDTDSFRIPALLFVFDFFQGKIMSNITVQIENFGYGKVYSSIEDNVNYLKWDKGWQVVNVDLNSFQISLGETGMVSYLSCFALPLFFFVCAITPCKQQHHNHYQQQNPR
jgi:hypothetical protein